MLLGTEVRGVDPEFRQSSSTLVQVRSHGLERKWTSAYGQKRTLAR